MIIWEHMNLLAEEIKEFGLNTNLFETNLINIILLVILLTNVLGNFLISSLTLRQNKIIENVQGSEKKLADATKRLEEANLQWEQANISLEQLKQAAEAKKIKILENQYSKGKQDLEDRFDTCLTYLRYRDKTVFNSVIRDTTILIFFKVKEQLTTKLGEAEQGLLIDKKINLIGSI